MLAGVVLVTLGCSGATGEDAAVDLPADAAEEASDVAFETHPIFPPDDAGAVADTRVADTSVVDVAPAAPTKVVLTVTWKGQETGYWCGPGSTRMALSTRMSSTALPSQTTLASYLGTTTAGTDNIGLVAGALNHYLGTTRYKSVDINDPPTTAQHTHLKTDIVDLITEGWPLVANVISGWRPPGYPSGTIYHYIAIVGFDEGGEKVLIADPAGDGAGGSSWSAVPRTYWVSLSNLATWIGGKGYTGR
ncbi:MAG: C39 family peptidase [Polyangiales bacterium]